MNDFKYTAPGKLRKVVLSLALGWREESGNLTDANAIDGPEHDLIVAAVTERPGDRFEWRPA
jgi:hypothetical protein